LAAGRRKTRPLFGILNVRSGAFARRAGLCR
jgi:hypothetical protein